MHIVELDLENSR